jgi:hypothetical protein
MFELAAPGVQQQNTGSFAVIITAVLFYFMALVFEYGTELQKESDSTL